MSNFLLKKEGKNTLDKTRKVSEQYMLFKVATTTHTDVLIDFQTYFSLSNNVPQPECSNIIYYKVLDQKCDDKETLLSIINDLYSEFILSSKKRFVLLEGNQATYMNIFSLSRQSMYHGLSLPRGTGTS